MVSIYLGGSVNSWNTFSISFLDTIYWDILYAAEREFDSTHFKQNRTFTPLKIFKRNSVKIQYKLIRYLLSCSIWILSNKLKLFDKVTNKVSNYRKTYIFASLYLRAIINIFIRAIFQNIITYLDRTFKEGQNDKNFQMK